MWFARWFQPPRRTLAVFLCLMLVLGCALGWLGRQLLQQDRALEKQRLQVRLELAANRIAATLQGRLLELEAFLNLDPVTGGKVPPEGVVILALSEQAIQVYPPNRLLYYPKIPDAQEPPDDVFAEGEMLEYRRIDPVAAAAAFRRMAQSANPAVRAGALLRMGRNLRKAGRNDEALQTYAELEKLGAIPVLGLPAELQAMEARCTLLMILGKHEELHQAAARMNSALRSGRWMLLRPAWEFHVEEAQRWLGQNKIADDAIAVADAANWLNDRWRAAPDSQGRTALKFNGHPVLISWKPRAGGLVAVVSGPAYLRSSWQMALNGQRVQAALLDSGGLVLLGSLDQSAPAFVRAASEAQFPWTLQLASSDPGADSSEFALRRRLLASALAVLALMIVAGTIFILRSIERELAVARLQTDFVSAVSHEFRTPLTSLRQLSEMLAKGRVPTEELRQQSYELLAGESERLQRLVESLLDFGRIEGRAFQYHFAHQDAVALVGEVVREFAEKAAAKDYQIAFEPPGSAQPVRADREALGLALRNLLDNAVKYSPDCRTIWVEIAALKNRLAIRVQDRGMGIPAAEQKTIFKKFVRGTASRSANIKGTGIGLAMARHIVEDHGGEIRLESEPGRGSTFSILLPREKTA
jgi:signal transduction histidine kinase